MQKRHNVVMNSMIVQPKCLLAKAICLPVLVSLRKLQDLWTYIGRHGYRHVYGRVPCMLQAASMKTTF